MFLGAHGVGLWQKGEIGYVTSIGTFLQQFYIYGIEFTESGNRVGMKRKELEPVVPRPGDGDDLPLPGPTLSERAGGIG